MFDIVLREGDGEVTVAFDTVAAEMRRQLERWRAIRDGKKQLEPLALDSTMSPWRKYANQSVYKRYFNQQRQVFAGDQEFFWILLIAS